MGESKMQTLIQKRAQELRKNMTLAEKKLWSKLRFSQIKNLRFRRQVPLGNYIADFACFEPKIIIELDGSQHMNQIDYDQQRTAYLKTLGYEVLRVWNTDELNRMDACVHTMWGNCIHPSELRHLSPSVERRPKR